MSTVINGSSPSITFSDGTTQSTAANISSPYTANGVVYASSTSALATGSALTFDGSNFKLTGSDNNNGVYSANSNGTSSIRMQSNAAGNYLVSAGPSSWYLQNGSSSGFISFAPASSNEAMRLDSSGNLLVGTTSTITSGKQTISYNGAVNGLIISESANTANTTFLAFNNGSSVIGAVSRVGSTSAVVYATTSDYRLKTVTGAVTGQGSRIDALKPVDYQWKESNTSARGFLAHEFQAIYPNSVSGTKDAVDADGNPKYQAMQASNSEVIADLVAEIQSLRKRILTLENK